MSDKNLLDSMWQTQDQFNELVLGKKLTELTPAEINQWADKYGFLLVREVAEFINELNTKPHRKEAKTIIRSNLLEEWIDIFKYWLCLGRLFGFSPQDLREEYYRKSDVVMQRFFQEKQLQYIPGKVAGVDIDGVLADYPAAFINFVNRELGTDFNPVGQKNYHLPESLGLPLDLCMELKHKYRETGQKRFIPVKPGAKELLEALKQAGYTIVLLTARPYKQYKRIFADTQEWLNNNGLLYDSIIWDEDKNTRLVREFGQERISFFIEDVAKNANQIAALGVPCYLINAAYNEDAILQPGVIRVNNLAEVAENLKERGLLDGTDRIIQEAQRR